jgi:hypothetical protein
MSSGVAIARHPVPRHMIGTRSTARRARAGSLLAPIAAVMLFELAFAFKQYGVLAGVVASTFATGLLILTIRDRKARLLYYTSTFFLAYCLIGIPNFSSWRGYIWPQTQTLFFFGLQIITTTIFFVAFFMQRPGRGIAGAGSGAHKMWRGWLLAALLVPGLAGTAYLLHAKGLNLGQDDRFGSGGLVHVAILSMLLPLSLAAANIHQRYHLRQPQNAFELAIVPLAVFCALVLGYRNAVIGVIICFAVVALPTLSLRKLLLFAAAALAVAVGFGLYRRYALDQLGDIATVKDLFDASDLPDFFAELHFAFREGFGLSNTMMIKYGAPPEPIFFADLMTLAPGFQPSGGSIVAALSGGAMQGGGLNPGFIGLCFFEFGEFGGGLFMAAVVAVFAVVINWKLGDDRISERVLVGIPLYELLLLFHRGDLRAAAPLLITALVLLVAFRDSTLFRRVERGRLRRGASRLRWQRR